METVRFALVVIFLVLCSSLLVAEEAKIKIGIPGALTGDASGWGLDIKNSLVFANKKIANNAYELIFV